MNNRSVVVVESVFRRLAVDEAPVDVELGRVEHELAPVGERVVVGRRRRRRG